MPFEVAIVETEEQSTYLILGVEALQLRQLGLSFAEIGGVLGVCHTTAARATRWARRPECCG